MEKTGERSPLSPGSDSTDKNCPVSVVHFNDMNPGLLKCFAKDECVYNLSTKAGVRKNPYSE